MYKRQKLTFLDDTVLRLVEHTEVVLTKYYFDPNITQNYSLAMNFVSGTARFATGGLGLVPKENIVNPDKTRATGPLVKTANDKKIQDNHQTSPSGLANLLHLKSKELPIVLQRSASLTAILPQIITKGEKANTSAATTAVLLLKLFSSWGYFIIVSPKTSIKRIVDNVEQENISKVEDLFKLGN